MLLYAALFCLLYCPRELNNNNNNNNNITININNNVIMIIIIRIIILDIQCIQEFNPFCYLKQVRGCNSCKVVSVAILKSPDTQHFGFLLVQGFASPHTAD